MEAISYPLRIPKNVIELANLRTKEEHVDKSTALRQFLYLGARDYVMELYQKGRISLGKAAELLDVSTFDILRLAKEHDYSGATGEQLKISRETAKSLII
ncbi:MAG: UPF0175 family protein [Candidatus Methanoperedens sp.]|jgi:hypothetical protein|nr:UPF0175 family protein [Candidatus Methanoperedens sp.]PKL54153.1 MAG: hypothetical protein CVV36_03335 [Candidatus Methanoperedenaceae archaeon HGW-Methanoperedenaceae-1]